MRTLLCFSLYVALGSLSAWAQSDLAPEKRADLVVKIDFERYSASAMGKVFPLSAMTEGGPMLGEFRNLDFNKLQHAHVLLQAPNDLGVIMGMQDVDGKPLPFNFVVAAQSSDRMIFDDFYQSVEESSDTETIDGKTYFRPPGGPINVAAVFGDEGLLQVGTDEFLARSIKNNLSDNVTKLANNLPPSVLHLAIDLSDMGELIDELVDMNGLDSPAVTPFITALEGVAAISGFVDFDNERLLQLEFVAKTEDKVETIKSALEALVGLAQTFGMGPEVPELFQSILKSMKVKVDGKAVTLFAVAPKDMADQLKNQILPMMEAEAANVREMNDMRQVALAMHNYADSFRQLPQFAASQSNVDLSWRVLVLPFIEEVTLYEEIDTKKAWDSAENQILKTVTPRIYGENGMSRIAAIQLEKPIKFFDGIVDGTSNTIAFVQVKDGIPWAANRDLTIPQVLEMFANMKGEGEVLVAMYDGSVQMISASTPPATLKAMLTPDGGEVIDR